MGIFDSLSELLGLGGSKDQKQNTTQNTNQTQKYDKTQQTQQQQTGTSTTGKAGSVLSEQSSTQNLSQFSPEQLLVLNQIIGGGNPLSEQSQGAADLLSSIATNAAGGMGGQNMDMIVKQLQDAAKLSYQENEAAQINQISQDIGSGANAFTQLLRNKGATDLATKVGGVEAETRLAGAQIQNQATVAATQAAQAALQGQQSMDLAGIDTVLKALQIAKGGTVTGQTDTSSLAQTEELQSTEIMNQILGMLQETGSTTSSSTTNLSGNVNTSSTPGLLDILSLFKK